MTEASFVQFLARSLAVIEDDMPWAARAIADRIESRTFGFHVAHEQVCLDAVGRRLRLRFDYTTANVKLTASSATMRWLASGELSLLDAVLEEQLSLFGSVDDLIAFDQALVAFAQAAMRSRALIELRDTYLLQASSPSRGCRA